MDLKEKRISFIILALLIIIIFLVLSSLFRYSFVFADDTNGKFYSTFMEMFKEPNNGNYFSSFLYSIFCIFIPKLLNIHPSDFKSEYFCYIESIFIICFIFILNNILTKKISYLYPIYWLFTASLMFSLVQKGAVPIFWFFEYDGLFRMFTPVFILISLFYALLKDTNRCSFKNCLIIYLLTFLCCISNEMICITTSVGFLILSIIYLKSEKTNLLMFSGLIVSLIGFFIMCKAGAFMRKSEDIIFDYQYFIEIIKAIPCFTKEYFKYIFLNHAIGYILLFVQLLILFIKIPSPDNKDIINAVKIIFSFLIGILIFFFLLIGIGQIHDNANKYYIVHDDLHAMFDLILLAFNYSLFSIIIKNSLIKKRIIFLTLLIFSLYLTYNHYNFYKNLLNNTIITWRIETYEAEKIIRLAKHKNKIAMLDKALLDNAFHWGFFYTISDNKENVLYTFSPYSYFIDSFEKLLNQDNEEIVRFIFTDKEIADREFAANGGVFTEEELKNIKFNRLRDKKFLLNN